MHSTASAASAFNINKGRLLNTAYIVISVGSIELCSGYSEAMYLCGCKYIFQTIYTLRNQLLRMFTIHIQETTRMLRMLVFCLFVILTEPSLVTMDTVKSVVNITRYVGETIELKCFDPSVTNEFNRRKREVSWMYLFQDDCIDNSTYVNVAECDYGTPCKYLYYGHQLVGNEDLCDNCLAYMIATEPGHFTYKCEVKSREGIDVKQEIQEVTFMISIAVNSSISPCLAKYVPPSQNLTFDFICVNVHQRGCLTQDENVSELFIKQNGVQIIPDISLSNMIVVRIWLQNISSISQYHCTNQNHSSQCVVDNVTLSNPIGITPIVNRVIEGGDAIFECVFKDGHESDEKYKWRLSRHIESSRISSTASSTLIISEVKFEDDGVVVMCVVDVNDTIFYSQAFLKILIENGISTLSTEFGSVGNSLTITNATTILLQLPTTSFINVTSPPVIRHKLFVSFGVFVVIFICGMCIIAVAAANSKTRRRLKRLTNKDSSVQGAIGLPRMESNARLSHSPTAHSPTPRRPSAAASPLPLTPSPEESSELCPGAMSVEPESSHQQKDHSDAMPSPRIPCQSPPLSALLISAPNCYHVYYGLEEEQHPLSTSSFGATSMPKCPIKSKSSSKKTHKSGKISTTQTLSPYEINRSVSLPSKKTSKHSCTGSPLTPLTRKGSATDQPLPTIPKSKGSYDEQDTITESRLSMELPVAVIKPMIHGYSSIQDDQQVHGDEKLSTPDAPGPHSPSAPTTTNNVHERYTGYTYGNENLQNILVDGEIESSSRSSSLIPECHTYAVAGNDADKNIAGTSMSAQSIYHTIDEEKSGTLLSAGGQPVRRADDTTSAKRDSVSSNRHIYEMPVDNIAPEVNNQSNSAETTFYFTLESEKDRNSRDVTVEQSPT